MLRGRIPFHQMAMATIVGVIGGVYVYKPVFVTPTGKRAPSDQSIGECAATRADGNVQK